MEFDFRPLVWLAYIGLATIVLGPIVLIVRWLMR